METVLLNAAQAFFSTSLISRLNSTEESGCVFIFGTAYLEERLFVRLAKMYCCPFDLPLDLVQGGQTIKKEAVKVLLDCISFDIKTRSISS